MTTSEMLTFNISLTNYIHNGIYNILIHVKWIRFLHSCNINRNIFYMIDEPYNMTTIGKKIEKLPASSEYNITVRISNAVGDITNSSVARTLESGIVANLVFQM